MAKRIRPSLVRGPYSGCWEWTGLTSRSGRGHGLANFDGRMQLVHRGVYAAIYGAIPEGLCVLHRCDNPPCFNPSHLFLGTQADNIADMVRKGRQASKLSPDQVREIRAQYPGESQRALARKFGISQRVIGKIVRRELWAHLAA